MKRIRWKLLLRLILSGGVLAFVASQIDAGELLKALSAVDPIAYGISLLVAILGSLVISLKYHLLARGTAAETTFGRVVAINFIARFFGLLVPSGAGQAAVRWYKMTRDSGVRVYFFAASVFERLLFLTVGLLFVLVPLYAVTQPAAIADLRSGVAPILLVAAIGLLAGFAYFLVPAVRGALITISYRVPILRRDRVQDVLRRLSIEDVHRGRLLALLALSVLWQAVYVVRVYALFSAVGVPMSLLQVAWVSSLVFLLQALPVSIAGLGVREGAYVYIFSLYGFSTDLGFALGLLFFTHMLVFAAIGGILNVTEALSHVKG